VANAKPFWRILSFFFAESSPKAHAASKIQLRMPDFDEWLAPPAVLALAAGGVHIWRADLRCTEPTLRHFEQTLVADEKFRAGRFYFERDRNHFIAARGILRDLLGRYLGCAPETIRFAYREQGKPALCEVAGSPHIEFNVSHSHGLALLAFSRNRALGVDIERIRPDISAEEIAERYFSPQEVVELLALPPASRAEGFFRCWTRKEAYVKARGEGLQISLKSFHVSLAPGQPARLVSADSERWSLYSLRPFEQSLGAIVAEGQDLCVHGYDWSAATLAA
jgi:4'-phosphopantetheinyl transferase